MCIFTCGFVLQYLSLFQTKSNMSNVITTTLMLLFVMHLFIMSNMSNNHENIQRMLYCYSKWVKL